MFMLLCFALAVYWRYRGLRTKIKKTYYWEFAVLDRRTRRELRESKWSWKAEYKDEWVEIKMHYHELRRCSPKVVDSTHATKLRPTSQTSEVRAFHEMEPVSLRFWMYYCCVAWGLKRVSSLPLRTHFNILYSPCDKWPIEDEIYGRSFGLG